MSNAVESAGKGYGVRFVFQTSDPLSLEFPISKMEKIRLPLQDCHVDESSYMLAKKDGMTYNGMDLDQS